MNLIFYLNKNKYFIIFDIYSIFKHIHLLSWKLKIRKVLRCHCQVRQFKYCETCKYSFSFFKFILSKSFSVDILKKNIIIIQGIYIHIKVTQNSSMVFISSVLIKT